MGGHRREAVLAVVALLGAVPIIFTLVVVIILPAEWWGHAFPVGGYVSIFDDPRRNLHLLGPPSALLGVSLTPVVMMLMVRHVDAPVRSIVTRLAYVVAWCLSFLAIGVVVAELVFGINGLAYRMFTAAFIADLAMVQALTSLLVTFLFTVMMFARLAVPDLPPSTAGPGITRWTNPLLIAGAAFAAIFVAAAIVGPELAADPHRLDAGNTYEGPSWSNWLGTTRFGQDLFSQVLTALRNSFTLTMIVLSVGFAPAVAAAAAISHRWPCTRRFLGAASSYAAMAPSVVVFFVLAAMFPFVHYDAKKVLAAAVFAGSIGLATGVRLAIDTRDVIASIRAGAPYVVEGASWVAAFTLLFEATVSFFGFREVGADITFGSLIEDGAFSAVDRPYVFYAPALTLTVIVFSFLLIALRLATWRLQQAVPQEPPSSARSHTQP
jgi:peptide/nickel transport system permease protein